MRGRKFWTALAALMLASTLSVHHLHAQAAPPKPDSSKTAKKASKTAAKTSGAKAATATATQAPPTPMEQKKIDRKAAKTAKKADKPVVDAKNATAKCKDGSYTATQSRSGACSGHGGVAEWMKK